MGLVGLVREVEGLGGERGWWGGGVGRGGDVV